MGILIRKYNKNRKFIWLVLGTIIVIMILISTVNNEFKPEYIEADNGEEKVIDEQFYDISHAVITSQKLDLSTSSNVKDIIKNFINYCNAGQVENAYNMLSQDCKDVLYPTLETFKNDYYIINFASRKTYNLQSWDIHNNKFIYKVELLEDMLSEGKVSNIKKQDYFTVVQENDKYYLNISGFIEKKIIETYQETESMDFLVESQEIFMEYLNLNINITNKTKDNILLDSGEKTDTVYITDTEGIKFISFLYENDNSELIIQKKSSEKFKIKFMRSYNSDSLIDTVNFEDIILDYEESNTKSPNVEIEI